MSFLVVSEGDLHNIQLKADDSNIDLSDRYASDSSYRFDIDDADLNLTFPDQHGVEISIAHRHANFNIGDRFELVSQDDQ